jgi:hypothetical protein
MKKALPFILVGLIALFVVLVQLYFPKPINWMETFEKKDKNPYGDFILHDFLKDIFPGQKIEVKDRTFYEVLDYYDYTQDYSTQSDTANTYSYDTTAYNNVNEKYYDSLKYLTDTATTLLDTVNSNNAAETVEEDLQNSKIIPDIKTQFDSSQSGLKNYVVINSSFSPGESDVNAILKFVQDGNCVFIAAQEITGTLADSLNIKTKIGYYEEAFSSKDLKSGPKKDSIYLTLLNTKLKTYEKKYWYRDGTVTGYFSSIDTANTLVLGKNSEDKINFIRVQYGAGVFLISSTPLAFTNYNMMLANNAEYIAASLSYLPVRDTYWDEYYKNYREADTNSLRFIESQPPLYWAYYLSLCSAFIYIVFESKRRQRVIPVVEPPRNSTLEFVSTIGRLYFQNGNHKDIAAKKIYYFLEYIRTNFYLNTNEFDKEFIEKVAARSGIDKTKVSQLFALIQHFQKANGASQADLLELNKRLEEFRKESKV